MTTQPQLPDPIAPSVIEQAYIEDSPRGLWPENQDSNFGIHRKIFCDQLMEAANQLQTIFNEMFPDTSTEYIGTWEEEMGLTVNPPGRSLTQRQRTVSARLKHGPFTRTGRANLIEGFIIATYGAAATFGTSGIVIGAGIPLHSGAGGDPKQYYKVIEDISNFKYHVWIDHNIGVDLTALNQELLRVTPAGISFDISSLYQTTGGGKSSGTFGGTKVHTP